MKTIALIDYATGGHRDAFMCLFAKACLDINVKVVCIYPKSTNIKEWINQHAPENSSNIIYVDYPLIFRQINGFGKFNHAASVLKFLKQNADFLKKVEQKLSLNFDLVYFNWVDVFMSNYLSSFLIDKIFPYKWSGLYFHPTVFRVNEKFLEKAINLRDIDNVFTAKNCVAVTLHDEGILERYQRRIKKPTILFPEIADITAPNENFPLAKTIREKANGRTVVGSIGLEYHKGSMAMIQLCKQANPEKFFFAFTGNFDEHQLSFYPEKEREEVLNFIKHLPENAVWKTGLLKEGEEYNSIFCSFDIIYIVYKNFYSSSNRLTKAANFQKLVLATNKGCVGDDVPKYNLGEVTNEDNIEEQLEKIERLRDKILQKDFPYEQWKIYSKKHSTDSLKEKFQELLNLV